MQRENQSKLNRLIQELCPEGVEYRKLLDVTKVTYGYPADSRLFTQDNQYIPLIRIRDVMQGYSETYYKGDFPESYLVHKNDILVGMDGEFNLNRWNDRDALLNQRVLKIESLSEKVLLNGFIFHLLAPIFKRFEKTIQGSTVKHLSAKIISGIDIPVPPLPVQSEIVRILDAFTALTAELTAELTARRKQYEYYRDRLLKFDDLMGGVRWVSLNDVCYITSGGTPSKTRKEYWDGGTIKWLGSSVCKNQKFVDEVTDYITEEGLNNSSAKIQRINTTLIAMVGATIGKVAFLNFEATTNQNIASLYPKDETILLPDFLYYVCTTLYEKFEEIGKKGFAIANLSFIKNLPIPLPPLSEQRRIVSILDRFDALCNDLTQGLPAEIAARRKQYEFYRDRLLDFQRKE